MGVFTQSRHFVGGYQGGRHINGFFFGNHELFHYKTDLYVKYYNPINAETVTTDKVKLDWNKWYDTTSLPINIPDGYTIDPNSFLSSPPTTLGITDIEYTGNRMYVTYNVIPKAGEIDLKYYNQNGNLLSTIPTYGAIGTELQDSDVNQNIPTDFALKGKVNLISYSNTVQSVSVPVVYQPLSSTITINVINQSNQNIANYTATGKVGTQFNLTQYTSNFPSDCIFQSMDNDPSTFTKNNQTVNIHVNQTGSAAPSSVSSSSSSASNPATESGTITVTYVDLNDNPISSQEVSNIPGTPFDIEPYEIGVPNGYQFYQILQGAEITQFPTGVETLEIQVDKPTDNTPVIPTPVTPEPVVPAYSGSASPASTSTPSVSGIRVYVDTDYDLSENPCSYPSDITEKAQGSVQQVTPIIRSDQKAMQVPDPSVSGLKLSDVGLSPDSLILGPQNPWDPYNANLSYMNMYEYTPDTTQDIETSTMDGKSIIEIPVKPAYIHGITFQIAIPNATSSISKSIVVGPNQTNNIPTGWRKDRDEFTGQAYFVVPYGYKITAHKLLSYLMNGASKGSFTYKGTKYTLYSNRSITFRNPYTYTMYCKRS